MTEAEKPESDSYAEQIAESIETDGKAYQVVQTLADNGDGMAAAEIADALGWTEDEMEEVLHDMEDRGLIGPLRLEERVYVGDTDHTLAEAADTMGMTTEETLRIYAELEKQGFVRTIQVSKYEYLIWQTEEGQEAAGRAEERPDSCDEPPDWYTAGQ